MSTISEPIRVVRDLGVILDGLHVRWAAGGSLASSLHGIPRATQDVDVIVEMGARDVPAFAKAAGSTFLVDDEALAAELARGRCYNVLHAATMTKTDLFPARQPFVRNELDRAVTVAGIRVVAAEDAVIAKLGWFREGGEVSDRQWRDVLGIFAVQGSRLDHDYLRRWCADLGLLDLLESALGDRSGGL